MNEKESLDKIKIDNTLDSLKKNSFDVQYCKTKEDALKKIIELINRDSKIGFGGSRTLEEIGFFNHFIKDDYPNLLDRNNPDITPDQKLNLSKEALTSDFFLSSANAISQDGDLILIDKWGNRNSAMTFGPVKRIFVIGKNKIAYDLNSAIEKAKDDAAVLNNIRFETNNPCTKEGCCMDCNSTERLCCITTIIERCQPPKSILILLIDENLGF